MLLVGQPRDVDLAQVLVREVRAGDHDPLGARRPDVEPQRLGQSLPQGSAVPRHVCADAVDVEHLDLGPAADALTERRQLVLRLQIGLDAGERPALNLAGAGVLGGLAAALQHRLRHPPPEALASAQRQQRQERQSPSGTVPEHHACPPPLANQASRPQSPCSRASCRDASAPGSQAEPRRQLPVRRSRVWGSPGCGDATNPARADSAPRSGPRPPRPSRRIRTGPGLARRRHPPRPAHRRRQCATSRRGRTGEPASVATCRSGLSTGFRTVHPSVPKPPGKTISALARVIRCILRKAK